VNRLISMTRRGEIVDADNFDYQRAVQSLERIW
jgi:hypothetical protein